MLDFYSIFILPNLIDFLRTWDILDYTTNTFKATRTEDFIRLFGFGNRKRQTWRVKLTETHHGEYNMTSMAADSISLSFEDVSFVKTTPVL